GRVVGLVKRHSPTENSEIIQRKATHLRHTTSARKFCQSSHVAYAKPTAGIRDMLPYEPEAATLTPRRSRKGSSKVRTVLTRTSDEQKPACLRCTKHSRTCGGYETARKKKYSKPLVRKQAALLPAITAFPDLATSDEQ
ncbi:unnamed protein product, partial [Clonostachys chloroleuca]